MDRIYIVFNNIDHQHCRYLCTWKWVNWKSCTVNGWKFIVELFRNFFVGLTLLNFLSSLATLCFVHIYKTYLFNKLAQGIVLGDVVHDDSVYFSV